MDLLILLCRILSLLHRYSCMYEFDGILRDTIIFAPVKIKLKNIRNRVPQRRISYLARPSRS